MRFHFLPGHERDFERVAEAAPSTAQWWWLDWRWSVSPFDPGGEVHPTGSVLSALVLNDALAKPPIGWAPPPGIHIYSSPATPRPCMIPMPLARTLGRRTVRAHTNIATPSRPAGFPRPPGKRLFVSRRLQNTYFEVLYNHS